MLDALARFAHAGRRRILVAAVLVFGAAGAFGGPVAGILESDGDFDDSASESIVAAADVERATGRSAAPDLIALVRLPDRAGTPAAAREIARVAGIVERPGVAELSAYREGDRATERLVSKDRRSTYLVATFESRVDADELAGGIDDDLRSEPNVAVGGAEVAGEQVGAQVSEDLGRAEMLAFPLLFLVSLLVFRGLIAALLPLVVGFTTILLTFSAMRLVNAAEPLSIFALNLVIGMGLGLAIDYSLFVVSRFREELEKGHDTLPALRTTMATAGRTVVFSAVTVAAAAASLAVFPQRFLYSMAIGGALCALLAAVVSVTLLPALLAALGPRVNAFSPKRWRTAIAREASSERTGPWYRLSQLVMRRPLPVAAAAATLLIVAGLPFLGLKFTGVDASVLPKDRSARVVDDALKRDFPPNLATPVTVVVRAPASARPEVERLAAQLAAKPGAADVTPTVAHAAGLWRIGVGAEGDALSERTKEFVRSIRATESPAGDVRVAGFTAEFLDQQESLGSHLPYALTLLAASTLLILFLMTGSVVLPVKTLIMNLLTLSAAFGVLVLVFQDGRLEGLLDFTSEGALDATQPILLFAIAFGLSTDYGVFLLTRIKEARDAGASDTEAVALGLERTGRIVTFAALLFMIAIGAFATSEIIFIKELGVGTAVAVFVDATIVRALLVPALMRLLGHRNWWAPRPLQRLHARIGLVERAPA